MKLLVKHFELGLGQLVFLGLKAQAGECQLPKETHSLSLNTGLGALEQLHCGFKTTVAKRRHSLFKGDLPGWHLGDGSHRF